MVSRRLLANIHVVKYVSSLLGSIEQIELMTHLQLLKQLHDKLQDRMLLNRRDPFTVLPFEMAMMVVQHFSFKQIVGILRVCKGWERLFGSISHLWMNIDFSAARGTLSFPAVRSCIRRSKGLLTRANIKNLPPSQTPRTLEFLSRCPHIEHLQLWVSHDHKDFFSKFKGSKKLKSLVLSADMTIPHDYFGRLLIELPKLEEISLWNSRNSSAEFLSSGSWPTPLPNLKSITLSTLQQPPTAPLTQIIPALHLPNILSVSAVLYVVHFCRIPKLILIGYDSSPLSKFEGIATRSKSIKDCPSVFPLRS